MAVILLRSYGGYAAGAGPIIFPDATETALIAQGFARDAGTTVCSSVNGSPDQFLNQNGNISQIPQGGQGQPILPQGPRILPNIALGCAALTAAGLTSVNVTGSLHVSEIFVPYWNTWTGMGVLNGTTDGTDNMLVALYGGDGRLIANSAVAGSLSAGTSVFQNRAFLTPVTLAPGRYFGAVQANGGTAHTNKFVVANGSNVMCSVIAGVFGTIPATITVPTTFTTAVGCIWQLYT
jgi:hypothetical protein